MQVAAGGIRGITQPACKRGLHMRRDTKQRTQGGLALGDAETDVGNRYQAAETLRDAAHFQDVVHSITLRARGIKR